MAVRPCVVPRRHRAGLMKACRATVAVLSVLSVALAVTPASAQLDQVSNPSNVPPAGLSIGPEVGYTLPVGRFKEFFDGGPSATLRISYGVTPRTQLLLSGGIDRMRGAELRNQTTPGPDLDVIRVIAGFETEVLPLELRPWTMLLELGAGVTKLESDSFQPHQLPSSQTFSDTSPAATVGLQVGYDLGPVTLFADGQFNWADIDEYESRKLIYLAPYLTPLSSAWTFPVRFGFRL